MKKHLENLTDQELIDIVDALDNITHSENSIIRKLAIDYFGSDSSLNRVMLALPLAQTLAERMKRYSPHIVEEPKKNVAAAMNHYYNFEIYTKNIATGEGGWDIKFICVKADNIKEAKERLEYYPNFDEIILFDFHMDFQENCDFFELDGHRGDRIVEKYYSVFPKE